MSFAAHQQLLDLDQVIHNYRQRAVSAIQSAFFIGAGACFILFSDSRTVQFGTAVSCTLSAFSLWLASRQRLGPAVAILAAQFLLLSAVLSIQALGIYDSAMMLLPAGLMAVSVVESPKRTALFSLLTVVAGALVALATLNGWTGKLPLETVQYGGQLDSAVVLIILTFGGVVATYVSSILSGLMQTIANHQTTLEVRVAQRTQELAQSNEDLRQAMTTLDRARDELVRGEKLAGLGNLVAGVAHELNTPIGNSAMAASTLHIRAEDFARQFDSGTLKRSELKDFVDVCLEGSDLIMRSTQRAHELVASFKQVAVDQTSDRRRSFELDEVVEDVLRSLRPSFSGKPWTMDKDVTPGIICDGYPGPLSQVLTNLVQNAVLHGFADRDHGHVRISGSAVDANTLRLTVADDGHGIPAESLGRIFDPFFTTRLGQGGSGLGLTIVHNLTTSLLGGSIEIESEPGAGTRFIVTLPRVAPDRSPTESP